MTTAELQVDHHGSSELGRFARAGCGLFFLLLAIVSAVSAYAIGSFAADIPQVVLAFIAMTIATACALWAYRLLLNRPRRSGGLVSPATLRVFAAIYIGLPIASVATGAWRNNYPSFILVALQGLVYISWGMAMWRLARQRSGQGLSPKISSGGEH